MSASKRRRMEAAQSVLTRPFKSPFKRPLTTSTESQAAENTSCATSTPISINSTDSSTGDRDKNTPPPSAAKIDFMRKHGVGTPLTVSTTSSIFTPAKTPRPSAIGDVDNDPVTPIQGQNDLPLPSRQTGAVVEGGALLSSCSSFHPATPTYPPSLKRRSLHTSTPPTDSAHPSPQSTLAHNRTPYTRAHSLIRQLTTQERTLYNEKTALQTEIEALTTALAVLDRNKEKELTELEEKWRCASRSAAEEVWAAARERVIGMGGMAGLRAREVERRKRVQEWDSGGIWGPGGNDRVDGRMDDDSGDGRSRSLEEDQAEAERLDGEENQFDPDETFTMGTMLKQLGIDLDVIGYDTELEGWS